MRVFAFLMLLLLHFNRSDGCSVAQTREVQGIWQRIMLQLEAGDKRILMKEVLDILEKSTPWAADYMKNLGRRRVGDVTEQTTHPPQDGGVSMLRIWSHFDVMIGELENPSVLSSEIDHFIQTKKITRGIATEAIAATAKTLVRVLAVMGDGVRAPVWDTCLRKKITDVISARAPDQWGRVYGTCDVTLEVGIPEEPINGRIEFVEQLHNDTSGVSIAFDLQGFDQSCDDQRDCFYGYHFHERGQLTYRCEGAGKIYKPRGSSMEKGRLTLTPGGEVKVKLQDRMYTLFGEHSIIGRSLVIYKHLPGVEDDSPNRVACCVIRESTSVEGGHSSVHEDL